MNSTDQSRSPPRMDQVLAEVISRREAGERLEDSAVAKDHPHLMPELGERLGLLRSIEQAEERARSTSVSANSSVTIDLNAQEAARQAPVGIFPGYETVGEVHRGGQGVVYRAIQWNTGQDVAVKVMHEGPFAGSRGRARFEREVRILAQLKHPNIVTIHDSGTAAGSLYFVMDWVAGEPLDMHAESKKPSVDETLLLFAKICEAVNTAHLRGIIHRDLKPSNILVDESGEPQILDFGLAKTDTDGMGDATHWRSMTVTGQFVGSLPWASPEQAEGSPDQIDLRTDVYSLGVVLFQMLTGRFPYPVMGKMRAVLHNILEAEPTRPSAIRKDINDEVETIVLKCLAKEPERRYQSAGELARDVRGYLAGEPIEAKRDSTLYVLRKQMRRYRVSLMVTAGVVLLILASSVVAWSLYAEARENLWESHLGHARAHRTSGQPGRRFRALELLAKAAVIRPSLELRSEAIACLSLADVRIVEQRPMEPPWVRMGFDANLERYWLWARSGEMIIRSMLDDEELLRCPKGGTARARLRLSADGSLLARPTIAGTEVWDVDAGMLMFTVSEAAAGYCALDFDPDADILAIGTRDGSVCICDLATGEKRLLPSLDSSISSLRFHPSRPLLAVAVSGEDTVYALDVVTGNVVATFDHPAQVHYVAWGPNGRLLATGCQDFNAYVWDLETGMRKALLMGHRSDVTQVAFDPTGTLLMSSSWDGSTRIWEMRSGEPVITLPYSGERFASTSSRMSFVKGIGKEPCVGVAEFDRSSTHHRWIGTPVEDTIKTHGQNVAFDPGGRWLAAAARDGIRMFDRLSGEELCLLPVGVTAAVRVHPTGNALLSSGVAGVFCWPIARVGEILRLGPPQRLMQGAATGGLAPSVFAADASVLVFAQRQYTLAMLTLDTNEIKVLQGRHPGLSDFAISREGTWIATGTKRGTGVALWRVETGELDRVLPLSDAVMPAFTPDGRLLVTRSSTEIVFWDTGSWLPLRRLPANTDFRSPVAFSPDGTVMAVTEDRRQQVKLIDPSSLEVLAVLTPPGQSSIFRVRFSPDGASLTCLTDKGHVILNWDLRAIREQLAQMNLDWDLPPYPPATLTDKPKPLRVEVDLGELAPQSAEHATQE